MNEPRVVESVTNECQSLGRAHESSSARAEQLIACLEGEIAKRDARIVELNGALKYVSDEFDCQRAMLAAIKAQEPVAYIPVDRETGEEWHPVLKKGSGNICDYKPLYAAPVSEAKAQGVVQWPEADEIRQMVFEEGQPAEDVQFYCFELEEFDLFIEHLMSEVARLNAAPVQQVSVPDSWRLVPVNATEAILDVLYSNGMDESDSLLQDIWSAMLYVAPAAPAADAGLVAVEWAKDAEEWGPALNKAGWLFLSELNEDPQKSALIFNNCKGPLRAAIMKYAEIVAANAKDSSHD